MVNFAVDEGVDWADRGAAGVDAMRFREWRVRVKVNRRWLIYPMVVMALAMGSLATQWGMAATGRPQATWSGYVYLPFVVQMPTLTPTSSGIPPDDLGNEQAMAELLNEERRSNGLAALSLAPELTQASRRHSRDMADNNFTSHTGSDGSNGGQRMEEAGFEWSRWGEIIGWGFGGDMGRMVEWWMNSPTHRAIILSENFTEFGLGYARNADSDFGHYWTVNFGVREVEGGVAMEGVEACTVMVEGGEGGGSVMVYGGEGCE